MTSRYSSTMLYMILAGCILVPAGSMHADPSQIVRPIILFKDLSFDFGRQMTGVDLTHVFVFTNQGTGALLIEKVESG